jgi:hypothetical protein
MTSKHFPPKKKSAIRLFRTVFTSPTAMHVSGKRLVTLLLLLVLVSRQEVVTAVRPCASGVRHVPGPLRLRGGGGVFEGELSEAHGLGRVSETLRMRERIGANCGDPANVPPDVTSYHHLDSLAPQQLFESVGTDGALTPSGELMPEWEEQGRNFLKAHVARGAAMIAENAGASLHLTRALHGKFDADGDGFMQREDLEALLAATEPEAYNENQGGELGQEKITPDVWQKILNDTCSDPAEGLSVGGLFWLYSQPGEDLRRDCWTVFGTEGMMNIPHYNPLLDIFPDPNMFRPASTGQPEQNASHAGAGSDKVLDKEGVDEDSNDEELKLRRWVLEEGSLPADHDVWDDKSLDELAPKDDKSGRGKCWHEQDWGAVDLRLLRDMLFEISLKADCKQRPVQADDNEQSQAPIMAPPDMLLHRPPGPVETCGLTWNE